MRLFLILLVVLLGCSWGYEVLSPDTANHTIMKPEVFTKPGCQRQCGNLLIPYPFGIKSEGLDCAISPAFEVQCSTDINPPLAFPLDPYMTHHIHDISDTELRLNSFQASKCYNQSGPPADGIEQLIHVEYGLDETSFAYSTVNVLTVVGCDDYANLYNDRSLNHTTSKPSQVCSATCPPDKEIREDECSGTGCCQIPITSHANFSIDLLTYKRYRNVSYFNQCGFAFVGEKSRFRFQGMSYLNDSYFRQKIRDIPIVLDWFIANQTCGEAQRDQTSYACKFKPRIVNEGTPDQLEKAALLVRRCLNLNGAERPTMMEVAMELQNLRGSTKHPWANQQGHEEIMSLKGHSEIRHSDLYDIKMSSGSNLGNDSELLSPR
uniref:Wall-associated receptor kinase galacturonan-binding domain-containing protein n=1 Tax=Daucus carota subsp. sativus TaxID=79200 RepID=A0A162B8X7_DAUCS